MVCRCVRERTCAFWAACAPIAFSILCSVGLEPGMNKIHRFLKLLLASNHLDLDGSGVDVHRFVPSASVIILWAMLYGPLPIASGLPMLMKKKAV